MERRENARDRSIFYGCSNFPLCEQTVRACPRCGSGLPVKSGETYHCPECGGAIEACPVCDGWLDTRMGKYGRFLGCSNFQLATTRKTRTRGEHGPERSQTMRRSRDVDGADCLIRFSFARILLRKSAHCLVHLNRSVSFTYVTPSESSRLTAS